MEDKVIEKLTSLTEEMYSAMVGQIKNGYYSIWNPRFQELNRAIADLQNEYQKCKKGEVLEKYYQKILECQKEINALPEEVFEQGNVEKLDYAINELPTMLKEIKEAFANGINKYDQVEARVHRVYDYEREFVSSSKVVVEDYKLKLRNRITQNIGKVRQFEQFSEEERRYFMTHVLFFDEGKIESTILECLNEAEQKVVSEVAEVERRAIISPENMDYEQTREYVQRYREKLGKQSPKELSISRRLLQEGEIENKFETWFNSVMGEDSNVGQLINEGNKSFELPIEEQMYEAMESVVEANLGDLKMTDMIEAYAAECADLKEESFASYYGDYEEIKGLILTFEHVIAMLSSWEARDVSMADIILGNY